MKDVYILGIETSCDETAAAVVKNGREICSDIVYTQIPIHQKFGGVVPEVASRNHVERIMPVVENAIKEWGESIEKIDAVAVTYGPGLVGAVLVGLSTAKALSYALKKPLIGVNHIEGHIAANYIAHKDLKPPFISLVVSGGHTNIVEVCGYNELKILGGTVDDAAGEAFDKVARALGLGYPGGPKIDELSKKGKCNIKFPMAFYNDNSYNFSFSGLKSAVLNYINSEKMKGNEINKADVAASFQYTVVKMLIHKSVQAVKDKGYTFLVLSGGVSANSSLRHNMSEVCEEYNMKLYYPPTILCTDNAAMIASKGYYLYMDGKESELSLAAKPGLKIGEI